MSIWKDKGGRFHVGKMVGGKRVHRILPKDATARDAKRVEGLITESLEADKAVHIPGNPLISEVMSLYIQHAKNLRSPATAKYHALRAGQWATSFRANQARAFAATMVRDMHEKYAPGTINRTLGTVKKALHLAWELGAIPEDYSRHIKRLAENNAREVTWTKEQVAKIAAHCTAPMQAAIWISFYTGARRGEVVALRPEDIGPDNITIRAANTKTLKARTVPIVEPLREWLAYVPLPLNAEGLKTSIRRAREAVGKEDPLFLTFNYHDLRRSCATLMIEKGVDLYVVSKVLGHSSVAITQARYGHMQTDRLAEGLKRTFEE
jgi:integrase